MTLLRGMCVFVYVCFHVVYEKLLHCPYQGHDSEFVEICRRGKTAANASETSSSSTIPLRLMEVVYVFVIF